MPRGISSEKDLENYTELLRTKPKKSNKHKALLYDWEVDAVERIEKNIAEDDTEARAVFARLLHFANESLFGKVRDEIDF